MKQSDNPMVFALSTDTLSIKKYPTDDDGNIINSRFNAKTFTKKAYKSYLKGLSFFKYKGDWYPVPKMRKDKLQETLENLEINE
jgi:hypothetical protein